ncbi:MAG: sulfite exporter TauE/SafE family protein [Maricaulaceae bacterium]|nr:sulfite exporter TauE/SafE family protein [Maricaulaceae bacterium]
MDIDVTLLAMLGTFFAAAVLYGAVGHGGGSAYLAVMALFGVPQDVMRPTALVSNIGVAGMGAVRFTLAGFARWRLYLPFLIGSAPFALLGGSLRLPDPVYGAVIGLVLLFSAVLFFIRPKAFGEYEARPSPVAGRLGAGAGIGLLAGLTGTGGGIFLSPLLIFLRWAPPREAAGAAAVFVLVNSLSGLAGQLAAGRDIPLSALPLACAALLGGAIGGTLGIHILSGRGMAVMLGGVLAVAGLKMLVF